jgi:hypothetical protein
VAGEGRCAVVPKGIITAPLPIKSSIDVLDLIDGVINPFFTLNSFDTLFPYPQMCYMLKIF